MKAVPFLQKLFGFATLPVLGRFRQKLSDPTHVQFSTFQSILRSAALTEFGQSFGLNSNDTIESFRKKIPFQTYESLEPWIKKQMLSNDSILFSEPITLYERTSGSSGAEKLIPYTKTLRSQFALMATRWLSDVTQNGPHFKTGKIFFSISPPNLKRESSVSGKKVGMENDVDYLESWQGKLLSPFFVVPSQIKNISEIKRYRFELAKHLLECKDLEIISIWNPTYFTAILDYILKNRHQLSSALSQDRHKLLETCTSESGWDILWPEVKFISCWMDAQSQTAAANLKRLFPRATFQPKGLLCTEQPITFPLTGVKGGVPLIDSVFLEFLDHEGNLKLIQELKQGATYEVIASTRGGFLRYRVGDQLRVVSQIEQTPTFEFVGRTGSVSDLVGEKLNEIFVREALSPIPELRDRFWILIPQSQKTPANYALLIDTNEKPIPSTETIDQALRTAFHYQYARDIGQLGIVTIKPVPELQKKYYDYYVSQGMKWGDIKYSTLVYRERDALYFANF